MTNTQITKRYKQLKLKNNLRVILAPMPGVSSTTALVLGNTGSRFETQSQLGIAHFFEHMVFKGTKKYPTPLEIATTLDAVGAQSNAFTSKEYTGYYVKSASRHLPLALDVLSQMMFAPLLKEKDIKRESGVIIEEINMYLDQPMHSVGNLFENMMYEGSGLAHDILGTKESVASFKSDDFHKFLSNWYGPANLTLVIAGDARMLEDTSLIKEIESRFDTLPADRENKRQETYDLAKDEPKFGSKKLAVKFKETEQAHLILAWPGFELRHKKRPVLSLLSVIMGGNMSSRLFVEVREKQGLGYYVRSEVDFYHHTGSFGAAAGVDPKRTHQALEIMMNEFYLLADGKKPITAKELNRAKEFLAGQTALSLEDSRSVAQWFGLKDVLLDKVETPEESLAKIKAVSLDQVNQLVQELIKDGQMRLALIGPFKEKDFRLKI